MSTNIINQESRVFRFKDNDGRVQTLQEVVPFNIIPSQCKVMDNKYIISAVDKNGKLLQVSSELIDGLYLSPEDVTDMLMILQDIKLKENK